MKPKCKIQGLKGETVVSNCIDCDAEKAVAYWDVDLDSYVFIHDVPFRCTLCEGSLQPVACAA